MLLRHKIEHLPYFIDDVVRRHARQRRVRWRIIALPRARILSRNRRRIREPRERVTRSFEARLDWNDSAERLARKVRAFNPWPICEAIVAGERLRIHAAMPLPLAHHQPAGKVLAASKAGVDIACSEGALRLLRVQREGGRPMSSADYLNAQPALRKA